MVIPMALPLATAVPVDRDCDDRSDSSITQYQVAISIDERRGHPSLASRGYIQDITHVSSYPLPSKVTSDNRVKVHAELLHKLQPAFSDTTSDVAPPKRAGSTRRQSERPSAASPFFRVQKIQISSRDKDEDSVPSRSQEQVSVSLLGSRDVPCIPGAVGSTVPRRKFHSELLSKLQPAFRDTTRDVCPPKQPSSTWDQPQKPAVASQLFQMQKISSRDKNEHSAPTQSEKLASIGDQDVRDGDFSYSHEEHKTKSCVAQTKATRNESSSLRSVRTVEAESVKLSTPLSLSSGGDHVVHKDSARAVLVGRQDLKAGFTSLLGGFCNATIDPSMAVASYSGIEEKTGYKLDIWDVSEASKSIFITQGVVLVVVDLVCNMTRSINKGFREKRNFEVRLRRSFVPTIERIAEHNPGSIILPLAVVPQAMSEDEVDRRCKSGLSLLEKHVKDSSVSLHSEGIVPVRDTDAGLIGTVGRHLGLGEPVSQATVVVLEILRRLRDTRKIVSLTELLLETRDLLSIQNLLEALDVLSSTGDVMYWRGMPSFVVLDKEVLASAVGDIMSTENMHAIREYRRETEREEPDILSVMDPDPRNPCACFPMLRSEELREIWSSNELLADDYDMAKQNAAPDMFIFLEQLFVRAGVLQQLDHSTYANPNKVFFVPGLLQSDTELKAWHCTDSRAWRTKLAYSWQFPNGAPLDLMDDLMVSLFSDLFAKWKESQMETSRQVSSPQEDVWRRYRPIKGAVADDRPRSSQGPIDIQDVRCWTSSFSATIITHWTDEHGKRLYTPLHIYVHLDAQCRDSNAGGNVDPRGQRLFVTCEGPEGGSGRQMWQGGLGCVLNSLRKVVKPFNVECRVSCPNCIAQDGALIASTWPWEQVERFAISGSNVGPCQQRKHFSDSYLLSGIARPGHVVDTMVRGTIDISRLKQSVVMVGLWDENRGTVGGLVSLGSGFIANAELGLILTTKHTFIGLIEETGKFQNFHFGVKGATIVVGVIPSDGRNQNEAIFRYCAEIVPDDIWNLDACVLRITARFKKDVDESGLRVGLRGATALSRNDMRGEKLVALKMATSFGVGEDVSMLGFPQGGEGRFKAGSYVDRSVDLTKGFVSKDHKAPRRVAKEYTNASFTLQDEVVAMCPTIGGHSGCPCVNNDCEVVGILSGADPVDQQRCYLVPSPALTVLLHKADDSRPPPLEEFKNL